MFWIVTSYIVHFPCRQVSLMTIVVSILVYLTWAMSSQKTGQTVSVGCLHLLHHLLAPNWLDNSCCYAFHNFIYGWFWLLWIFLVVLFLLKTILLSYFSFEAFNGVNTYQNINTGPNLLGCLEWQHSFLGTYYCYFHHHKIVCVVVSFIILLCGSFVLEFVTVAFL